MKKQITLRSNSSEYFTFIFITEKQAETVFRKCILSPALIYNLLVVTYYRKYDESEKVTASSFLTYAISFVVIHILCVYEYAHTEAHPIS